MNLTHRELIAFTIGFVIAAIASYMGVYINKPNHVTQKPERGVYIPGAEGATITPNTISPKYDSGFSFKGATVEILGWQKLGIYYDETKKKLIYVDNLGREFQIEATLQKVKLK